MNATAFDFDQAKALSDAQSARADSSMVEIVQEINKKTGKLEPVKAQWHLLRIQPGMEELAASHLIARKFGIYLPMFWTASKDRYGKTRKRMKKLFPGYLFVFVWDVKKHWHRITSCPGVIAIELSADKAVVVPDGYIRRAQEIEIEFDETIEKAARGKKRKRRRRRGDPVQTEEPAHIIIHAYDAMHDIRGLDDDSRNQILRKALGLAS